VLYIYYGDGDSSQWVQASTPGADGTSGLNVTTSDTAPTSPSAGDFWWDSDANALFIYYTDADSSQWVQATTPGAAGVDGTNGADGVDGAAGADGTDGATPGRNKFINGNFDVWQRGTSFTATGYTADRWKLNVSGSSSTLTQQEFTLGQTDVPNNPKYYLRLVNTTNSGAGDFVYFEQRIEDVRTFQGETVTVSFWAKADAPRTIAVEPYQDFGTGGSPSTDVPGTDQSVTLSTNWTKYTVNLSVNSITGKTLGSDDNSSYFRILFWMDAGSTYSDRVSVGNQSGTFEFSQLQVESGSSATDFEHKSIGETIQDCKRYYVDLLHVGAGGYATASGQTARAYTNATFPVEMRVAPTATSTITQSASISAVGFTAISSDSVTIQGTSSASGSIWYRAVIELDAEL